MPTMSMSTHGLIRDGLETGDPDLDRAVVKHAESTGQCLDRIADEMRTIQSDSGLTPEGAAERRRAWIEGEGAAIIDKIASSDPVQRLRADAERRRTDSLDPKHRLQVSDSDSPRTIDAERRVNEHLRRVAASEGREVVVARLLQAARQDDRGTLRAVELDPLRSLDPVVPEEALIQVSEAHARTRFAELWNKTDRKLRAATFIDTNRAAAVQRLSELTGGVSELKTGGSSIL